MRTLLIIALLCPATLMAEQSTPQRNARQNEFSVELEGINLGSRVRAVDIEDQVIQKIPLKITSGNRRYYRSGPLSPIGIKLEVIKSERNSEILDWYEYTLQGRIQPKSLIVTLGNDPASPLRAYRFLDCVPYKYAPTADVSRAATRTTSWTLAVTCPRLELSGKAGSGQYPDLVSVSDGSLDISLSQNQGSTLTQEQHETYTFMGYKEVSDLKLSSAVSKNNKPMLRALFRGVGLGGKPFEHRFTVIRYDGNGSEIEYIDYQGCFLTRFVFPRLSRSSSEHAIETLIINSNYINVDSNVPQSMFGLKVMVYFEPVRDGN